MTYTAPLDDMHFTLETLSGLSELAQLEAYAEAQPDVVTSVMAEAARFSAEVLAPLNQPNDQEGARFENGWVHTPKGLKEAAARFREAGWMSLPFDPDHGGQGLPWSLALAVEEMWLSAHPAFGIGLLVAQAGIEALQHYGTPAQKARYLPNMISGLWGGTMCMTEPQAGSDVGALTTRTVREGAHYKLTGQKIYITWGDHDCAENIIHLVLGRLIDAPPGIKGLTLFLVPKLLLDADGKPDQRNDVVCLRLEEKLGLHASPTCHMAYGERGGAYAEAVGAENQGIQTIFTMMNNARLAVGLQGLAIAERAFQQASAYAQERVQGRPLGAEPGAPIAAHPDVKRMLMTMRAYTEGARALVYYAAGRLDRAKQAEGESKAKAQARLDLLTPIVKAWCTDMAVEVASLGIQVHGGAGYIEATGAAQHLRDARITPIYEGTNGIQAWDLVSRKLLADQGQAMDALLMEMETTLTELQAFDDAAHSELASQLNAALEALTLASDWIAKRGADRALAQAAATPFLALAGTAIAGWLLARQAATAARALDNLSSSHAAFLDQKISTARFYAANVLPRVAWHLAQVRSGAERVIRR